MESRGFWHLGHVSDSGLRRELVELLASSSRTEARVVAHLAEVARRKIYLKDGFSCLFKYCQRQLGLSENQAFHRMTAANIARRFPIVFEMIEQRRIHLSGLCQLRDFLTPENHRQLLDAVAGKTKNQVLELLAAWSPGKQVKASMRKRPSIEPVRARSAAGTHSMPVHSMPVHSMPVHSIPVHSIPVPLGAGQALNVAMTRGLLDAPELAGAAASSSSIATSSVATSSVATSSVATTEVLTLNPVTGEVTAVNVRGGSTAGGESGIEASSMPMARASEISTSGSSSSTTRAPARSPSLPVATHEVRYRVQFEASSRLKEKLELARALSSHSNPSGDLETLVERAIDVYVEALQRKRFGKTSRPREKQRGHGSSTPARAAGEVDAGAADTETNGTLVPAPARTRAAQEQRDAHSERSRVRIGNATRREVVKRDGLRCSYVSPTGVRCDEQAFLQFDHELAWARNGSDEASNLRMRCAAHNRFHAERDFGATHVAQQVERARKGTKAGGADGDGPKRRRNAGCLA